TEVLQRDYIMRVMLNDDRMRANLVSIRKYCGKGWKFRFGQDKCVIVEIKVGDRVLPKIRCKNKSIRTLAAGKRITGASNQHRPGATSPHHVIACATIKNCIVAFRALDRDVRYSSEVGFVHIGYNNRQRRCGANASSVFRCVGESINTHAVSR